ncbi:MAG: hypothetical protein WBQ25_20480 [Nitrososphaeraceae archaeon]
MAARLPVYGHTFSQNENSLFLTRMDQMHSQLQLVQNLLSTNTTSTDNGMNNTKFAQTHMMEAIALLSEKDPVSNFTWNQEIAERNQRVANDLVRGLNDLTVFINQKASSKSNSKIGLANESSSVQDKINNLGGLLDEAISARVAKDIVNNSTNQALVLANIGNEIFYSYGQALGYPYAKLANVIATMNISAVSSSNMNMQGKNRMQSMNNMNNMNHNSNKNMQAMDTKVNMINESDYQNAQAYVKQAQEIASKYVKSPVPTNINTTSDIQSQLNKILSQLETTINSKGSFSTVMNLIHLQLHPKLIANYKIS